MKKQSWHDDNNYDCPATSLADTLPGKCICKHPDSKEARDAIAAKKADMIKLIAQINLNNSWSY